MKSGLKGEQGKKQTSWRRRLVKIERIKDPVKKTKAHAKLMSEVIAFQANL